MRNGISLRQASSGENSTSSVKVRANLTASTAIFMTWSGSFFSLCFIWIGEVAMNVWMRFFFAGAMALPAASISTLLARARAAITGPFTCSATSFVASNCAGDEMGNPASMMSTPSTASCRAISSFCGIDMAAPGDCSPSRNVVSKMTTFSPDIFILQKVVSGQLSVVSQLGTENCPPGTPIVAGHYAGNVPETLRFCVSTGGKTSCGCFRRLRLSGAAAGRAGR